MTTFNAAAGLLLLVLCPLQEKREDNSWLRCKPGTFLRSKFTLVTPDRTVEDVQTLTLKEIDGDDYVIEETYASPGSQANQSKRSRGVKIATETVTIDGKNYKCGVNVVKGTNDAGPSEATFWTPEGSKNAVKVVFKQKGFEGEVLATAVDVKVTAMGNTYLCNKLEGKVKVGDADGILKAVLCEDIPGSQISAELLFDSPGGKTKVRFEAIEIHEVKK